MSTSQRIDMYSESVPEFRGGASWFIGMAVAFIVAGMLAIIVPFVAGLAVAALVGWLLVAGGLMHGVNAFRSDSITRAAWQVFVGAFYVIAGLYFVAHPLIALGTLTISLAAVLFCEAIMDFMAWSATRHEHGAGWLLVNTIATALLSLLIWLQWPSVSVWVVGVLVGAKLIISGVSRLMLRSTVREHGLIS
jgi:uncharacterized membrane protein HdeD (DUF308 family)